MPKPRVYVCGERGCGSKDARRALVEELDGEARVVKVSCQSVCDGPVAGVVVGDRLEWFEKVGRRKARAALVHVVRTGDRDLRKPLVKRRRPKRAGKLRG